MQLFKHWHFDIGEPSGKLVCLFRNFVPCLSRSTAQGDRHIHFKYVHVRTHVVSCLTGSILRLLKTDKGNIPGMTFRRYRQVRDLGEYIADINKILTRCSKKQ